MKFPDNADIEEYKKVLQFGALKGASVGMLAGLGAAFYLKRRTSFFVGAGGFQRVLVYAAPVGFCTIVNMELTSRSFEAQQREKQHGKTPTNVVHSDAATWDRLSSWALRNKYKLIVGGWAASLAGSFWLVNRDPFMTKAQKIVQARVYAQGLTVALLVGSVFLSVADKPKTDKQRASEQSRSWERDIQYVETANHPHGIYANAKQLEASKKASAELAKSSKSTKDNNSTLREESKKAKEEIDQQNSQQDSQQSTQQSTEQPSSAQQPNNAQQ